MTKTEIVLTKVAKSVDGWIHNKIIQDYPSARHIRKWHSDGRGIGRCSAGWCMSDRRYRKMVAAKRQARQAEITQLA